MISEKWNKKIHLYKFHRKLNKKMPPAYNSLIDVVIPIIEKDLVILPLCLEEIRKHVCNKIDQIYLIAPISDKIIDFCKQEKLILVDKKELFYFSPSHLNMIISDLSLGKADRSGWLFQQFIKLSGKVGKYENDLCIDADHRLINDHVSLDLSNRPVLYFSENNHTPYYHHIHRLIGKKHLEHMSYATHKIIFNKFHIRILHRLIKKVYPNKLWWEAILEQYDRTQISGFSEFVLYGNFINKKYLYCWQQIMLHYTELNSSQSL